jgi:hypothetical protein
MMIANHQVDVENSILLQWPRTCASVSLSVVLRLEGIAGSLPLSRCIVFSLRWPKNGLSTGLNSATGGNSMKHAFDKDSLYFLILNDYHIYLRGRVCSGRFPLPWYSIVAPHDSFGASSILANLTLGSRVYVSSRSIHLPRNDLWCTYHLSTIWNLCG